MTPNESTFKILRHLIAPEICRVAFDYCVLKRDNGLLSKPDDRVPTAERQYGDPLTETLLVHTCERIEHVLGEAVWPSYSYLRVHSNGADMPRHLDRDASQLGLTINLGGDRTWPIWFERPAGEMAVALEVGDGVLYEGSKITHWRDPYPGTVQVQCMLFFVRKSDPDAERLKYDGRIGIGAPRSSRLAALQARGFAVPTSERPH